MNVVCYVEKYTIYQLIYCLRFIIYSLHFTSLCLHINFNAFAQRKTLYWLNVNLKTITKNTSTTTIISKCYLLWVRLDFPSKLVKFIRINRNALRIGSTRYIVKNHQYQFVNNNWQNTIQSQSKWVDLSQ